MIYLTLILGFGLLMLCGDLLVRGSVGMAARFGVAPLIIALTIVAVGTSLPELFISADATLQGAPGLALGNIIGSNISNILLVLGLPALIYPIACSGLNLPANAWVMLASSLMLTVLCFLGPIARGEGVAFAGDVCPVSQLDSHVSPHPQDTRISSIPDPQTHPDCRSIGQACRDNP